MLGLPTRYDGGSKPRGFLPLNGIKIVPVCPEVLGGLATPRPRQELSGGDGFAVLDGRASVINIEGRDVTDSFLAGAEAVLRIARETGAKAAILKGRSPACASRRIWMDGRYCEGAGVAAALLIRNGITVIEVD